MLDATDPERLHQRIHQGHNCWVIDEEWELRHAGADRGHVHGRHRRRAGAPARASSARPGLSQVMLLPPLDVKEDVLRDVAAEVMPLLGVIRRPP